LPLIACNTHIVAVERPPLKNFLIYGPYKRGEGKKQRQQADPKLMGWEPGTKLKDGLTKTYDWIKKEMAG
jgi:nucleoside-diphosphate-sugar epimerase